tara:strand:+ start:107896 stop:108450 length:555 start_codon:yes stop_codon:yes gene_type:complete
MILPDVLFVLFASLTLGAGLLVVLSRNTVTAALLVVLSFVGISGLFLLLDATFLAALQILVYAGAVMVLFLFIVMLLDVEKTSHILPKKVSLVLSVSALLVMVIGVTYLLMESPSLPSVDLMPLDMPDAPLGFPAHAKAFGYALFTKYLLPLQTVGFLLLMAMVGVVVLSKSTAKAPEPTSETK